MYIDQSHIIVIYLIVILLFVIPLFLQAIRIKLFLNFNFLNLVKVLNRSIVLQLIIGLGLTVIGALFDKVFYSDDMYENIFLSIFIESIVCYTVIGLFFYLPAIGLINIINLLIKLINRLKKNI